MKDLISLFLFLVMVAAISFAGFAFVTYNAHINNIPTQFTYQWMDPQNPLVDSTQALIEMRGELFGVEIPTDDEKYTVTLIDSFNQTSKLEINFESLANTRIVKFADSTEQQVGSAELKTELFNQNISKLAVLAKVDRNSSEIIQIDVIYYQPK
jgi:hypothetical protein